MNKERERYNAFLRKIARNKKQDVLSRKLEKRILWWGMSVVVIAGAVVGYWLATAIGWLI